MLGSSFDISQIAEMYIDGQSVTPVSSYVFSIAGIHTVIYVMTDGFIKLSYMLNDIRTLITINHSKLDTSNVTTMYSTFCSCWKLTEVTMNGDVSKVTSVGNMFNQVNTTGNFYYNADYDYSEIIAKLPSTWTAHAI